MGVTLSILVFDADADVTPAPRLVRALEALSVWAPASTFCLGATHPPGFTRQEVEAAGVAWDEGDLDDPKCEASLDELRVLIFSSPRPDWLTVNVSSPIGPIWVSATTAPGGGSSEDAAMHRAHSGDVELHLSKMGRRFFQDPLDRSPEAEQLEAEIQAARAAGEEWKVARIEGERHALRERNARERSDRVVSLYETFATSFGARSVRSYLDSPADVAPFSSLIYYRDVEALCDDVAFIARAAEYRAPPRQKTAHAAALLGVILGSKGPVDGLDVPRLLARLRSLGPAEVRKAIDASPCAAPLAGGFLLANQAVLPVGDTLAPFFRDLLVRERG